MEEPVKRKRGRPRKVRPEETREPVREPMRAALDEWELTYKPEESEDRLHVAQSIIPDGMEYLWITKTVYGMSMANHMARFQRQGWRPVPSERHDGLFMPKGYKGEIEVEGLVLHERPKKISDMARAHEYRKATGQIRAKEAQLLGGGMGNVTLDTQHPSALGSNKINKSYEKIEIPEE